MQISIQYIIWKTEVEPITRDGITWLTWREWCLTWHFCGFGYEQHWYDGPHDMWEFGIGSLYRGFNSNYAEAHADPTIPKTAP
jgi:hypothetical protein